MKEIITNKGIFYFVEVSNHAYDFIFNEDDFSKIIIFKTINCIDSVEINKEDLQIISTTKNITEEQAESIVQYFDKLYLYLDYNGSVKGKLTAKSSLQSLIQANGLSLEKNYLILKKN